MLHCATLLLHFFTTLFTNLPYTFHYTLLMKIASTLLHFFITLLIALSYTFLHFSCYTFLATIFYTFSLHFGSENCVHFPTLSYTFSLHFSDYTMPHLCYTFLATLCYPFATLFHYTLIMKNASTLLQKTTAPRIPVWSPTMVLTRRHFG